MLEGLSDQDIETKVNLYFNSYSQVTAITSKERLIALLYSIVKCSVTQYFFCSNDIHNERDLNNKELRRYIEDTFKQCYHIGELVR